MAANSFAPRRMIEPLPNWRSIWESAVSAAFSLSFGTVAIACSFILFPDGDRRGEAREKSRLHGGLNGHSCGESSVRRDYEPRKQKRVFALFCVQVSTTWRVR
jgi:hypothetical protein